MDDSDPTSDDCNKPLRELFAVLNMESMRALTFSLGYATIFKQMIESGKTLSDEQILQGMNAIIESCRVYTAFMDDVKSDLYS